MASGRYISQIKNNLERQRRSPWHLKLDWCTPSLWQLHCMAVKHGPCQLTQNEGYKHLNSDVSEDYSAYHKQHIEPMSRSGKKSLWPAGSQTHLPVASSKRTEKWDGKWTVVNQTTGLSNTILQDMAEGKRGRGRTQNNMDGDNIRVMEGDRNAALNTYTNSKNRQTWKEIWRVLLLRRGRATTISHLVKGRSKGEVKLISRKIITVGYCQRDKCLINQRLKNKIMGRIMWRESNLFRPWHQWLSVSELLFLSHIQNESQLATSLKN